MGLVFVVEQSVQAVLRSVLSGLEEMSECRQSF